MDAQQDRTEALLEIMDGYVEIVTMLFERFCGIREWRLRGKARCSNERHELEQSAVVCRDLRQSRAFAPLTIDGQLVVLASHFCSCHPPRLRITYSKGAYNSTSSFSLLILVHTVAVLHTPNMRSIFARTSEDDSNVSHADSSSAGVELPHTATVSFPPTNDFFSCGLTRQGRRQISGRLPNQLFGLACWTKRVPGGQWKTRTLTCSTMMGCTAKDSLPSLTDMLARRQLTGAERISIR